MRSDLDALMTLSIRLEHITESQKMSAGLPRMPAAKWKIILMPFKA
jgi:hypothetical protein